MVLYLSSDVVKPLTRLLIALEYLFSIYVEFHDYINKGMNKGAVMKNKKKNKVMRNFRIRPDLVKGLDDLANHLDCKKISVLEMALEKLISEKL